MGRSRGDRQQKSIECAHEHFVTSIAESAVDLDDGDERALRPNNPTRKGQMSCLGPDGAGTPAPTSDCERGVLLLDKHSSPAQSCVQVTASVS